MIQQYKDLIQTARPDHLQIIELGSGDFNEVVLVDDNEVFKFPKSEAGKEGVRFETEVLNHLNAVTTVRIPQPIETGPNIDYTVFSFVPGIIYQNDDIDDWTDAQRSDFGHALAAFMLEINAVLSFNEAARLRAEFHPEFQTEAEYHADMLRRGQANSNPYLAKYQDYYRRLLGMFGGQLPSENMVAHGDLHTGNLLFTGRKLTGIIDFGDCGPGILYSELRQMYRLGDTVIQTIILDLADTFGPVNLDTIRHWAITHELSILMRPGALTGENSRADISRKLLARWLGPDWDTK